MPHPFPSDSWLRELENILNTDNRYREVAQNWEGDILFVVEPDKADQPDLMLYYLDLWHGQCRQAITLADRNQLEVKPKFILSGKRSDLVDILSGTLDPMQAMLTRRLRVEGNMAYMLRNVPTVLDFVRCCRRVERDPEPTK